MKKKIENILTNNDLYIKLNYLNQLELDYNLNLYLILSGKYIILNKKHIITIVYLLQLTSRNRSVIIKSKSNILNFNIKKKILVGYKSVFKKSYNNYIRTTILDILINNKSFNIKSNSNNTILGIDSIFNVKEITYELKTMIGSSLINYPGCNIILSYKNKRYHKNYLYLSSLQIPLKSLI
jgi:ribosomal protein L5